jgi:regulator of sigma E protease
VNYPIAIAGLLFLVLMHELGHFVVALAVGMRPRRFSIGFGPPLARITRRGIDYQIAAFPLGGYVKIPGMNRAAPSDLDISFGRALAEEPSLLGPLEQAKRGLSRDEPSVLEPLREAVAAADLSPAARKSAERGLENVGDALAPDAYWRQRTWKRIVAILAGPAANVVFAIVLFSVLYIVGTFKVSSTVGQVLPNHPAASAGLEPGDQIVSVNGQAVPPDRISELIRASNGRPLTLQVIRRDQVVTVGPVKPRKEQGTYLLGFRLRGEGLSAPAAVWASIKIVGVVTKGTVLALGNIVHKKDRQSFHSTVGIVQLSSSQLSQGVQDYLFLLAFVSLSLALLNLLPLLPLDGGHIVFSLIEGVRGRPLARRVYEQVSAVGIAIVLLFFFVGLSNDIHLGGG